MPHAPQPIRVTVWNEYRHELSTAEVRAIYPNGIHQTIKTSLDLALGGAADVRCATLDQADHGLPADVQETGLPDEGVIARLQQIAAMRDELRNKGATPAEIGQATDNMLMDQQWLDLEALKKSK